MNPLLGGDILSAQHTSTIFQAGGVEHWRPKRSELHKAGLSSIDLFQGLVQFFLILNTTIYHGQLWNIVRNIVREVSSQISACLYDIYQINQEEV
jgi:hypothetical protein